MATVKCSYYVPDWGEQPEDATEIESVSGFESEDAAEHIWDNRDGWESRWPIEIVILVDGKELGHFSVDMEAVPQFHGERIRENVEKGKEE